MRHALSIDVEDWYHDAGPTDGGGLESRVEGNTLRLLEILQRHGVTATFFFLGEVVERFPALARQVATAGHELGSHGFRHRRVSQMTRREFREDVRRSLRVIEEVTGQPVGGYRAPYFSVKAGVRWPIDILAELGVRYDSSVLPIDRPPGLELVCSRAPFQHANGLWEIPVATLQVLYFWHLPLASGNGLRLLPPRLVQRWVQRFERDVGAGVFYLHPWELDPLSPVSAGPGRWLLRLGRRQLGDRLAQLLGAMRFGSIAQVFAAHLQPPGSGTGCAARA
jgi:polysaccharide deacetylase family protein (PEP-CTERM system associated)